MAKVAETATRARVNAWRRRGIRYLSDVLDDDGNMLSFEQFKKVYQIKGSYLDYIGLIRSLPDEWKSLTGKTRATYPIIHPQLEFVLSRENGAKYMYDIILSKTIKSVKNNWKRGWELEYGEINWTERYGTMYQKSSVYYHIWNYI